MLKNSPRMSTEESFVLSGVKSLGGFESRKRFFGHLQIREHILHIVQLFDGFEGLHHMDGLVHAEFHFLFGDHAQAGFFRLNAGGVQAVGNFLERLNRGDDLDRAVIINDIIGAGLNAKLKSFIEIHGSGGEGKVSHAVELPAHRTDFAHVPAGLGEAHDAGQTRCGCGYR